MPTLRIPEKKFASSDQALIDLGLDPSRWIATVYWKEPGYEFRRFNPVREIVDPAPYIAVIRHIVEELGGQVVRIGHPTDIVIPELPGFIDLAKVENSHWLQMYAVSVSRFMLASASGPSAFGPAFGVPTVLTDHLEVTGVWRPHDYIVTRTFFDSDKSYRQEAAADAGFLDGYVRWFKDPVPGAGYHFNTAAELIDAANEMYQSTAACIGW